MTPRFSGLLLSALLCASPVFADDKKPTCVTAKQKTSAVCKAATPATPATPSTSTSKTVTRTTSSSKTPKRPSCNTAKQKASAACKAVTPTTPPTTPTTGSTNSGVNLQYNSGAVTFFHPGQLLASNCFQCHGTNGRGMESLAGESAREILEELDEMRREPAGKDIMNVHAQGYTPEQLGQIADYFSKQPR